MVERYSTFSADTPEVKPPRPVARPAMNAKNAVAKKIMMLSTINATSRIQKPPFSLAAGLIPLPESMCVVHIGHDAKSYSVVYPHLKHRILESYSIITNRECEGEIDEVSKPYVYGAS